MPTVKQSSFSDIRTKFEEVKEEAIDIQDKYFESAGYRTGNFVDVKEDFEEYMKLRIDKIKPQLIKLRGRLDFIIYDTNTSDDKLRDYRDMLKDIKACIVELEKIEKEIA